MPYLLPTSILGFNLDWVPAAGRLIWFSLLLIIGIGFTLIAMKPARFSLPMPVTRLLAIALGAIVFFYAIGVFIEPLQVLCFWINFFIVMATIALLLTTTTMPQEATWAQTIMGGIWVFFLMAIAYAMIPHEWITMASGYFGMTSDKLFITGGSQFPNIFKDFPKHLLPFEVSYEVLQDFVTVGIYVVLASINVKLFVMWQKREKTPAQAKADEAEDKKSKEESLKERLSAFGRPIKQGS